MSVVKNFFKYRGNAISPLASLYMITYGDHVAIRPLAKLERSEIGRCTSIGSMCAVYDCTIGNFCSIAREAYIGGASHPVDWVSTSGCFYLRSNFTGKCYHEEKYEWLKKTTIDHDVWIGARAIILSGVHISTGAVIGAGSVVTKDVGPYEIWAGNPARFIRKRFDDEVIEVLLQSEWWNWEDETLTNAGTMFSSPESFKEWLSNR